MEIRRVNTVKTSVSDISSGKYVKQEGFNPNYVISKTGFRVSRIRLMADVVDKFISENKKFGTLTLDDGKNTINVKSFQDISFIEKTDVGTLVDVIGKVREYQGEIYIIPEIICNVKDPNMEILRSLEISKSIKEWNDIKKIVNDVKKDCSDITELKKIMKDKYNISEEDTESMISVEDEEKPKNNKNAILNIIEENDSGDGCDYSIISEKSGLSEKIIESVVNEILEDGIVFEPKPGKIKKL